MNLSAMLEDLQLMLAGVNATEGYAIFALNPEGQVILWNDAAELLTGYQDGEITHKPFSVFYSSEHVNLSDKLAQATSQSFIEEETQWKRKDDKHILVKLKLIAVYEKQKLLGFAVLSQDITAIKKNQNKLLLALNTAQMGFLDWDIVGNIITLDKPAFSLFGLPLESENLSFNLDSFINFFHPDDRVQVAKEIQTAFLNKESLELQYRIVWPDKSVHFLMCRGYIIRDKENTALSLILVCTDITARKQLEEKQHAIAEAYQRQLIQLVDTLCHEIRNPLTGIYGATELLQVKLKEMEALFNEAEILGKSNISFAEYIAEFNDLIETLIQCAQQQKFIVDDVLELSRLKNKKLALNQMSFNPKNLLKQISHMFSPQFKKKYLKININTPDTDFWVDGDPARLTQIISNLLTNALKFTQEGGIEISLNYELSHNDAILSFKVKDTGIGMTQEEQEKLFQDYVQANEKIYTEYGGSGLGLSISKKLIELMGGKISLTSEKGKGTQFEFTIICKNFSIEKPISTAPTSSDVGDTTPKNILVVDDNSLNQKILSNYLRGGGHSVQTASNGEQAVELSKNHEFDIIFMDINMPGMNGLIATSTIRNWEQTNNLTPVWIIGASGDARPEQQKAALSCGMNDYLVKPYNKETVYKKINTAILSKMPQKDISIKLSTSDVSLVNQLGTATASPSMQSNLQPNAQ